MRTVLASLVVFATVLCASGANLFAKAVNAPDPPQGCAALRLAVSGSRNSQGTKVIVNGAPVGLPAINRVQEVLHEYVRLELDEPAADPAKAVESPAIRIVILGDSTVSNYPANSPLRGWGQVIGEGFKKGVTVRNLAASGRSTKTFLAEGRLKSALKEHADFALIQFGHNDSHGKGRPEATDPETDFKANLRTYIDTFREAGTQPILVTPMHRRRFQEGKVTKELKPYADAIKAVALEKDVPVVDLYTSSGTLFETLGE
ncbi:MAG: rhamnogalacturonan acetylesterase, partial [Isosphaeraceae bacterium]